MEDVGVLLTVTFGDFAGVVEVVPVVVSAVVVVAAGRLPPLADSVRVGRVPLGLGDSECADERVRVPDVEGPDVFSAPLLEADEELPVPDASAWAIPDPLASAAPIPRVSAPAPSQV